MNDQEDGFYEGWQDDKHVQKFDWFSKLSKSFFLKHFEYYNEIQLLKSNLQVENNNHFKFFDIGCATGVLYRYLKITRSDVKYYGFDISATAITRAKERFPGSNFQINTENDLSDIVEKFCRADIVFLEMLSFIKLIRGDFCNPF